MENQVVWTWESILGLWSLNLGPGVRTYFRIRVWSPDLESTWSPESRLEIRNLESGVRFALGIWTWTWIIRLPLLMFSKFQYCRNMNIGNTI